MEKFNFLTELEQTLVEAFYANETQREAVKKVLLMGIYENGVMKTGGKHNGNENWVYSLPWKGDGQTPVSNEMLGSEVRAIAEAIRAIETTFVHVLSKFKKVEPIKEKKNQAR